MRNCANKRKWYQPSYNMEYYQQETQAGRHVGIPHEKAEKHASFFIISSLNLWLSNEIRNAVWAKRVHWVIEKTCVRAFELRTPTFLSGSSFFREERWAINYLQQIKILYKIYNKHMDRIKEIKQIFPDRTTYKATFTII